MGSAFPSYTTRLDELPLSMLLTPTFTHHRSCALRQARPTSGCTLTPHTGGRPLTARPNGRLWIVGPRNSIPALVQPLGLRTFTCSGTRVSRLALSGHHRQRKI